MNQNRWWMSGIHVENISRAFYLSKEERDEVGRQCTPVNDAVEFLYCFGHSHLPFDTHPQSGHHVTNQQRRRQAMPHRISYRHGEEIVVQQGEIKKISANNPCRLNTAGSLVSRNEWRSVGQQAQLNYRGQVYVALHRVDMELKVQLSPDCVETEFNLLTYPTLIQGEYEDPLSSRISYCERCRCGVCRRFADSPQATPNWIVEDICAVLDHQLRGFGVKSPAVGGWLSVGSGDGQKLILILAIQPPTGNMQIAC